MKKILLSLVIVTFFATSFYTFDPKEEAKPEIQNIKTSLPALKKSNSSKDKAAEIYRSISFESNNTLNPEVFEKAFLGFTNLKIAGKLPDISNLVSIVDFHFHQHKSAFG